MRHVTRPPALGAGPFRFQATPWVKRLLMANAAVFLITVLVGYGPAFDLLAFSPGRILTRPWGVLTYMFVHAGLWHLLMNLLVLFFFGPPLESRWGSDFFIRFYLICGLGGVLLSFLFADATIVGASAACYGVMLAFAMIWPNAPIHIWGIVPVKAKWLVGFLAALSFVSAIGPTRDGVAHLAHLGGVITGFLFMKSGWMPDHGGNEGYGDRRGTSGRGSAGAGRWVRFGKGRKLRRGGFSVSSRVAEAVERRKAQQRATRERVELDAVDAILDKISARGVASLTAEERELLDRVSRKTQTN